jgi:hypothetical protein
MRGTLVDEAAKFLNSLKYLLKEDTRVLWVYAIY